MNNNNYKYFNMSRSHYHLMIRNMCNSLIIYKKIKTTYKRAKELQKFIEKIINKLKNNNLNNRRLVFSKIRNKKNVHKLINIINKNNKNGGYTKVIRYSKNRLGDNANLAYILII